MFIVHIDLWYNNNFSIYGQDIVPICTPTYDGYWSQNTQLYSENYKHYYTLTV